MPLSSTSDGPGGIAILQVAPALNTGGVERTTVDVAAALFREGFAAPVASQGGRMEAELAAAGGELIRMKVASKAPQEIVANAFRLRRIIAERNVRLIHARSRAPAWSARMAARMTGIPFVTTFHGIYNSGNPFKHVYNSVMARADAVIANSQWTADHIAREYGKPKRLAVIGRGVDLSRFDPGSIAPDCVAARRTEWGAGPDDIIILLPGRLTRWKGQLVLIDALTQLGNASIRAVFAGDAQGRDAYALELRSAIAQAGLMDRVTIAGHVADMATAYLAADIVVSASTDPEAFGRVAAEAGAMGRPVIATDHGGARETIVPNESGLLVPPGDAAALADAIRRVIGLGPDARARMGSKGRAHVAEHFTRDRMCAETIALYRTLLRERGSGF